MNKSINELTDIELATTLRDHMVEQSRITMNIQMLNQELESRNKLSNKAPETQEVENTTDIKEKEL